MAISKGQKVQVLERGKNLINYLKLHTGRSYKGRWYTVNNDGTVSSSLPAASDSCYCDPIWLPKGDYTFSADVKQDEYITNDRLYIFGIREIVNPSVTDSSSLGNWVAKLNSATLLSAEFNRYSLSFTITKEGYYAYSIQRMGTSSADCRYTIFKDVQIERSLTPTEYEPYESKKVVPMIKSNNLLPEIYDNLGLGMTKNGLVLSDNGNGTFTIKGQHPSTGVQTQWRYSQDHLAFLDLPVGTYYCTSFNANCRLQANIKRASGTNEYKADTSFTIEEGDTVGFLIQVSYGNTHAFYNELVKPMVYKYDGSTLLPFERYYEPKKVMIYIVCNNGGMKQ